MRKLKNLYHLLRAILANLYFGFPSHKLKVIGITGTDGKTTTSSFLHSILTTAGYQAGLISTLMAKFGDKEMDVGLHVTSPDTWKVQKILKMMVESKMEYAVLEVTSHALDQHRFWGVHFDYAGLTNITHEHLDYHRTIEEYTAVKLSLLKSADRSFKSEELSDDLVKDIALQLPGEYNYKNAKLAAAIAADIGVSKEHIKEGLERVTSLLGRMETVFDEEFKVVVDFAHTPNGLRMALEYLRPIAQGRNGRLIVVFGSAGERDATKRPIMGSIAGELADIVVVTAEDPRHEKVEDISKVIASGAEKKGKVQHENLFLIPDRQKAITYAISTLAQKNDVIVITGKGHEKSMNFNGVEQPWSDHEAVQKAFRTSNPS